MSLEQVYDVQFYTAIYFVFMIVYNSRALLNETLYYNGRR